MEKYQLEFIKFACQHQALKFGKFTLKSGRVSPYFFNIGLFNSGTSLSKLGYYYAKTISALNLKFDILFGPAYKGIPLVTATAIALAQHFDINVPFCFNRKEVKDHGEGGIIVGAPLKGRVLLIDDVITAGTAFNQSQQLIEKYDARITASVIALDRQERNHGTTSTIDEVKQKWDISVNSIITISHLIDYLNQQKGMRHIIEEMAQYRAKYGVMIPHKS